MQLIKNWKEIFVDLFGPKNKQKWSFWEVQLDSEITTQIHFAGYIVLLFTIVIKGPYIYDVSHFGGSQQNADILLTLADGRGGGVKGVAQSSLYKNILWVREN